MTLGEQKDLRYFLGSHDGADFSGNKPASGEPEDPPSVSSHDVRLACRVEGAKPALRLENQSIMNYLLVCPGRPEQKCGSTNVISKGEGGRWQCKKCGYKFRPKPTDLSPDIVRVVEIFFDSAASRVATVRNCLKAGINITLDQLDNILLKTASNLRRTLDVAKEAGVNEGILLLDGTNYKLRAGQLPALLAMDLKSKLIVNDAFAEEKYDHTLLFIKEIKENGYKISPFAIIDDSDALEKPMRQVYACEIQKCIIHVLRNILESKLPSDESCNDEQLGVKRLVTSILFVTGHCRKSYARALEKAKLYRERLKAILPRVDQTTASVIRSVLNSFDQLTTHLRHCSPHRDTNHLENTIRLIRKPIKSGLRQYKDRELVKAIVKLAIMRYEAGILGIRQWVRWSQRTELRTCPK